MNVTMRYENQEQREKVLRRMQNQNLFVIKNVVIAPNSKTLGGELHIDMAVVPLPAQPAVTSPKKKLSVSDIFWKTFREIMDGTDDQLKVQLMGEMLDAGWGSPEVNTVEFTP